MITENQEENENVNDESFNVDMTVNIKNTLMNMNNKMPFSQYRNFNNYNKFIKKKENSIEDNMFSKV
jgi:hypothetical protein